MSAFPSLDYANPLWTPTNGNLTYTATTDCYLVGHVLWTNNIKINNVLISRAAHSGDVYWENGGTFSMLKLTQGDVVTLGGVADTIHVFAEN
jgi:hypothetical protein